MQFEYNVNTTMQKKVKLINTKDVNENNTHYIMDYGDIVHYIQRYVRWKKNRPMENVANIVAYLGLICGISEAARMMGR